MFWVLIEMVLLSTHNMFWMRNKKVNSLVRTFNLRPDISLNEVIVKSVFNTGVFCTFSICGFVCAKSMQLFILALKIIILRF